MFEKYAKSDDGFLAESHSRQLDELIIRLGNLNKVKSPNDLQEIKHSDSLEQIALDLCEIYKGTLIKETSLEKQFLLIKRIEEQAQTGGEFYALNLIARKDRDLVNKRYDYIQKAATTGHLMSLAKMVGAIFAGYFRPLEDSTKWGLKSLRYLEEIGIPKLEAEEPNSAILKDIKIELNEVRKIRNEVLPITIPRESKAFEELVTKVVEYRKRRGGESSNDFTIALDSIDQLERKQSIAPKSFADAVIKPKLNEHDGMEIDSIKENISQPEDKLVSPSIKGESTSLEFAIEINKDELLQYIKRHLNDRLKKPFVSKDYTEEAKQNLYAGLKIVLLNAEKKLTKEHIIDVFNAMVPEKRANMKFPLRRGSVAFDTSNNHSSEQGVLELLEWAEKNATGYGPRFELDEQSGRTKHFKTPSEMRSAFECKSNEDLAKKLVNTLKTYPPKTLKYIPPFDSINPFIDLKNLTKEETAELNRYKEQLKNYQDFDTIQPKFGSLVTEFNKINQPSLLDIARFIKSMILLHPFPDGNTRTFTLGILNQLLLKNKLGICLELDPHIALLSSAEIATSIENKLIKLKQVETDKPLQEKVTSDSLLNNKKEQLEKNQSTEPKSFADTVEPIQSDPKLNEYHEMEIESIKENISQPEKKETIENNLSTVATAITGLTTVTSALSNEKKHPLLTNIFNVSSILIFA